MFYYIDSIIHTDRIQINKKSIVQAVYWKGLPPVAMYKEYPRLSFPPFLSLPNLSFFFSFIILMYPRIKRQVLESVETWESTLPEELSCFVTTKSHIQLLKKLLKSDYFDILYVLVLLRLLESIMHILMTFLMAILFNLIFTSQKLLQGKWNDLPSRLWINYQYFSFW